jgi:hypothetical protein
MHSNMLTPVLLALVLLWCVLQAVLAASQPSLQAWHPSTIAFALKTVGSMLTGVPGFMSPSIGAAALQWQSAAAAALQPSFTKLVPESCMQLLVGSNNIRCACAAADTQAARGRGSSGIGAQDDAGVAALLSVVAAGVCQALDRLPPRQLVELLLGGAAQGNVDSQLAQQVLAALQPQLR